MSYQTGPIEKIDRLYGLRWDINPAIYGVGRLAQASRTMFGPAKYLRMGPGNIIMVKVSVLNGILAILNTFVNFDLLVGQESSGRWGGYVRIGLGVGQETGLVGLLDTIEDYFSAVVPAANLIPTPVAWADQNVPVDRFGIFADSSSWAGISAAFSDAPTAGSITVGAVAEAFCVLKLGSADLSADD